MNHNHAPKNSNDKRIVNRQKVIPAPQPPKRANLFSQSSDLREDRSLRQMKNNYKSPTVPHGR